jgi:uncharacterized protein YegP (UPF0339 family)
MTPRFEIYRDAAGCVRWRLRSDDGSLLAASRAYPDRDACTADLERVRVLAPTALVADDASLDTPPGATAAPSDA